MTSDLILMAFGLLFAGVGAMGVRSTTASAARRRQLADDAFNDALRRGGELQPGGDFVASLPSAALTRARMLRPRAIDGRRLRWLPHVLAGHRGIVNLAAGTDGVVAEVTLDGIALLRQAPMRLGPPSTVGDGGTSGLRRCSTGDRAFDLAYSVFADDTDLMKHLGRQTNLFEKAREIFTTGGMLIDGGGGTLRVSAMLPLDADAVARFAAAALAFAACLDIDITGFHGQGALGGTGGASGSPFALPSA